VCPSAESLARASLDAVPAHGVGQEVRRDAEQPWQRRAVALVPEAAAREPGAGERLRGQVARRPVDPAAEPGVHRFDVPRVQLSEGRLILS
jgi:hypothetical protein